ncbi:MAG: hypothetical protein ACRDO7_12775 [Nocardioidaceae bacterium]
MPEDLEGLKHNLESTFDRPSFDRISERADATRRHRRARRVVVATSLAVASIVFAAVVVSTIPGSDEPHVAGPPAGERADGGTDQVGGEATYMVARAHGNKPIRVGLPRSALTDAKTTSVVVDIVGARARGSETVRYVLATGDTFFDEKVELIAAPGSCRDLNVSTRTSKAWVDVPGDCVPPVGKVNRWQVVADPMGEGPGILFDFMAVPERRPD